MTLTVLIILGVAEAVLIAILVINNLKDEENSSKIENEYLNPGK